MHSMKWWRCSRLVTEGRPGLAFSFPTAPAGGAALKQTSPYWYSFSVAVNSLGGCEVLLASTCAEHQLSADHCYFAALKQTSPYSYSFSVALNCLVLVRSSWHAPVQCFHCGLACVAMLKHPGLICIQHRQLQCLQTSISGHFIHGLICDSSGVTARILIRLTVGSGKNPTTHCSQHQSMQIAV